MPEDEAGWPLARWPEHQDTHAVRGLGCPVRFTLTAGQKGDAPQAAALLEGLPAEVVMADAAYDADHLREAIAAKGALAVIPNNPSRALKYPLDKHLYGHRHLVECCFSKLKSAPGCTASTRDRRSLMTSSRIEGRASRRLKICAPPDRSHRNHTRPSGQLGGVWQGRRQISRSSSGPATAARWRWRVRCGGRRRRFVPSQRSPRALPLPPPAYQKWT